MPRLLGSGSPPSQELRHFTNREQERHVLNRLLALPSGQPLPVVMFYGVGGTGKSWLLRRLRAEVPPEIPAALLDFDPLSGGTPYHTDYSRALAELRRQLASVECPRFDLAYSWLRFHEGVKEEPLLKDRGLAGIATEVLAQLAAGAAKGVPLVGFFTKKVAAKVGKTF